MFQGNAEPTEDDLARQNATRERPPIKFPDIEGIVFVYLIKFLNDFE